MCRQINILGGMLLLGLELWISGIKVEVMLKHSLITITLILHTLIHIQCLPQPRPQIHPQPYPQPQISLHLETLNPSPPPNFNHNLISPSTIENQYKRN